MTVERVLGCGGRQRLGGRAGGLGVKVERERYRHERLKLKPEVVS